MKTYRSKTTGVFVGRQVDQVDGEEYETVEVPTNPKEDLIEFLNTIQSQEKVDGQPSEEAPIPAAGWLRTWQREKEEQGAEFHLALELDEAILRAPFAKCMRLAELVYARLGDFARPTKSSTSNDSQKE